ncbi:amino acid adenylation domain-containing protein [Spinactinospora alkalitolerans]|uniref:Amino acid adenylation domain-containing protein n=1 Tax=Spinactinospora alkalitolerans TaxID=687207 RepID=A0A852TXC3_9ACTN|nr:non-ribosomal peptide synthetase [Spinactinospora alkalitolerans]NYE48015.1 amino acid adenylation domain-containing protein [Spinactinospora alkalitolerans]
MFAARVAERPEAPAVIGGGEELSYAELDARSERVARYLGELGVRRESPVVLMLERSTHVPVWLLAVVKAGGVCVPVHHGDPGERIRRVVDDTGAGVLVADSAMAARIPPGLRARVVQAGLARSQAAVAVAKPDGGEAVRAYPGDAAYIMYTSGSTGRPKGVVATHRNVTALAADGRWTSGGHERVLAHSPLAFDASTYEIWVPLLTGGTVVMAPPGAMDAAVVRQMIDEHRVTGMFFTTALFNLLAEEDPECFRGVREIWTGGETASPVAMRRVLDTTGGTDLVHVYGPTETTTFATCASPAPGLLDAGVAPIGVAMAGMRAHVLDEWLRPVPQGVTGELYIAGTGVARGYLGQPVTTAERFLPDLSGGGGRMYRTGDLVRRLPQGGLEFRGRVDDQVKIRGHRVEPGEVETVLGSCPHVARTVVLAAPDHQDTIRLTAYVVPAAGESPDSTVLAGFLAERLPGYMVPDRFVELDELPLTPNGKVDRERLPVPDYGRRIAGMEYVAPSTPMEEAIARVWGEVLDVEDPVGVQDDFFDLGGDSIRGLQIVARLRDSGIDITVKELFERPTIAEIAATRDVAGTVRR